MSQVAENVTFQVGEAKVTIPAQSVMKAWLASLIEKHPVVIKNHIAQGIRPILAEGERYAGILLSKDGAPDCHLVLLPADPGKMEWSAAKDWAASIGGELPTRREQALLYANLPEEFERTWYWSNEQRAEYSLSAWVQDFGNGIQVCSHKGHESRARAVRRSPI